MLKEKITVLEPLAHRTSTQNHLSMMLARVEGLEALYRASKTWRRKPAKPMASTKPTYPAICCICGCGC